MNARRVGFYISEAEKLNRISNQQLETRHAIKKTLYVTTCCLLVIIAGCSFSRQSSSTIATEPTSTIVSTLTPTSLSTATPTPFSPPGWFTSISTNWSGYSVPQSGITGVRAQWNQPTVSGVPNSNVYIWIGVGGWGPTFHQLVQIGTLAYIGLDGKSENNDVWYETLPQRNVLTPLHVLPGDQMSAIMALAPGSSQNWSLSLTDISIHQTFSIDLTYPSSQIYADFIVEDPYTGTGNGAAQYPFAHFSPVTFSSADVRYGQQWVPLAALRSMQVTLRQSGNNLAIPGKIIGNGTFTVMRVGP